jgi:hypothetical protein
VLEADRVADLVQQDLERLGPRLHRVVGVELALQGDLGAVREAGAPREGFPEHAGR